MLHIYFLTSTLVTKYMFIPDMTTTLEAGEMGKGSSLQFPTPFAEKVLQRYHQHEMTSTERENRGIMHPRRRTRMVTFGRAVL
jgi:hypothetical protein